MFHVEHSAIHTKVTVAWIGELYGFCVLELGDRNGSSCRLEEQQTTSVPQELECCHRKPRVGFNGSHSDDLRRSLELFRQLFESRVFDGRVGQIQRSDRFAEKGGLADL